VNLINLKLKNFKGIKSFELQANGQNVNIWGDNATGKTSVFDAFTWLFYDKDSQNKKDFDIKTLDANNQPIHGLEHEVEAVFDIDGKPLTLRKVYYEQWTKKRGSATAEFTGHTTDYYINGVPVQKKEYTAKIDEIAREDVFKLLTSPTYFNTQLHWQERRKVLLEVCGDVSDQDVISSKDSLKTLPEILNGRSLDDHKKVIAARRAEINKELEKIPIRISEVQQSIPELSGKSEEELQAEIAKLQNYLSEKNQALSFIENGGAVFEKRRELQEIEAEIIRINNENQKVLNERIQGIQQQLFDSKNKATELKGIIQTENRLLIQKQANLSALENSINGLREQWAKINAEELKFEQEETCPTCGQSIPKETLEAAREKALADFNQRKAEQLERNVQEGKRTKEEIEKLKVDIEANKKTIADLEKQLADQEAETARIQVEIDRIKAEPVQTTNIQPLLDKKQAILNEIDQLQTDKAAAVAKVKAEIAGINDCIVQFQSELAKFEQKDRALRRIEELKQQERDLAAEFEKLEKELYLCEEFTRSKVALLEEKINSRFKFARFKLFETQINGGIQECCETLYNGVPYSSGLNTGHQLIVGMDIIQTLSEYYGFSAPIFVDNAECVTDLPEINAQVIRLVKPEIRTEEDRQKYSKLNVEYSPIALKEAS
jgi:DNA repair exonuclease SbcCD ATPase subunit